MPVASSSRSSASLRDPRRRRAVPASSSEAISVSTSRREHLLSQQGQDRQLILELIYQSKQHTLAAGATVRRVWRSATNRSLLRIPGGASRDGRPATGSLRCSPASPCA